MRIYLSLMISILLSGNARADSVELTRLVAGDGRIFVGRTDGALVAMDPDSGKVEYTSVFSSKQLHPVAMRGSVLFARQWPPGPVLAIDTESKRVLWQTAQSPPDPPDTPVSQLEGLAWFQKSNGRVEAFQVKNGRRMWTKEGCCRGSLHDVWQNQILLAERRAVTAYEIPDGTRSWRYRTRHDIEGRLSVSAGVVVAQVRTKRGAPRVHVIDAASGRRRWMHKAKGAIEGAIACGRFVVLSARPPRPRARAFVDQSNTFAVGLDAKSGREAWRHPVEADAKVSCHDGRVVVDGPTGVLVIAREGQVLWERSCGESLLGSSADRLFLKTSESRPTRVDPRTGRDLWGRATDFSFIPLSKDGPAHRRYITCGARLWAGQIEEPYPSLRLTAVVDGRRESRLKWRIKKGAGTLPKGLRLSEDGRLYGTPRRSGRYQFTIETISPWVKAPSPRVTLRIHPRP